MKKHLLLSAALSLLTVTGSAQDLSGYQFQKFFNESWTDPDGYQWDMLFGYFNKVSANGKYAVGYDDYVGTGTAYRWCLDTPDKIELVNTDYNKMVSLYDITNDGVAVGSSDQNERGCLLPGYMTLDGGWTFLPVPEDYSESKASSMNLSSACAVTPDGKYIAGCYYSKVGEKESPFGGMMGVVQLIPAIWTDNNGTYELTEYRDLGGAGKSLLFDQDKGELVEVADEVQFNTFFVYDISNDGRTIVGVNTSDTGGQNPAFIRDGQLVQLYDCNNEAKHTFNGGICNSIDAAGNIYGYFQDDDAQFTYFIYTADGKLEFADNMVTCGTKDGQKFTQSTGSLTYTLDCSEDGSVIVGGTLESMGFDVCNGPAVLYNPDATGISRPEAIARNVSVNSRGGILVVNGEYSRADVYTATGALIATGGQGKVFNIGGQPAGAYIVKVATADGTRSFKVLLDR